MINECVLYYGELYYIVGQSEIIRMRDDGHQDKIQAILINKVETANVKNIQRGIWVPWGSVVSFISQIDYHYSEWYGGLTDGNK